MDNMWAAVLFFYKYLGSQNHPQNQVLLTQSFLKWPKYCLIGVISFVWRSVAEAFLEIPLGDDLSDLDSGIQ